MSTSDWLLILTAVLTGIATVITAYAGLVKTRRAGDDDCQRQLRDARRETELLAAELHKLRMSQYR